MISKLRSAGASDIIQYGASWAEADAHLREIVIPEAEVRGERAVYVHPFDGEAIWEGHSTLIDELVDDGMGDMKAVVCSVGGGGLFCGVIQGLERHDLLAKTTVVALETEGADSLNTSVKRKELVTLDAITSIATSLGARRVAERCYEYATREGNNVVCATLTDSEAVLGCIELAEWERLLVEPACGINVGACMNGKLKQLLPDLKEEDKVVVIVCGGSNVNIDMMAQWKKEMQASSC
jgi:L-serine/L-threonine ammonia-lyase